MTAANTFVHLEHLHRLVQHVKAAAKSLRELEAEKLPESVLAFASYLAKKGSAPDSRAFLAAADDLREMDLNYSRTVLEAFVAELEPHLTNALSRIEAHFGPQTADAESDTPDNSQSKEGSNDEALEGTVTLAELAHLAKESGLIVEDDIDDTRTAMDDQHTAMDELALESMGDDGMELYSIDDMEDTYDPLMDGEDFGNSDEVMDFEDDVYNTYASRKREAQSAPKQQRQSSPPTKRRTRRQINYV